MIVLFVTFHDPHDKERAMFFDFLTGALTVLVILLLIPFLWFAFQVSLLVAVPLAIAIGLFFGLVVIGKAVRYASSRYRKTRTGDGIEKP